MLAMALNCRLYDSEPNQDRARPCGACSACRKIRSGIHPDVLQIQPTRSFIRIDQIRDLIHTVSLKPYEARYRVAIVSEAHRMNPESGNAMLKILEEPPDQTLIVLTALQTSDLLPTIVSRCQHIRFHPIARDRLAHILVEKHGVVPERAEVLSAAAGGSLSRALDMIDTHWEQRRNALIDIFEDLLQGPVARRLAFAEILAADKEGLERNLEMLKMYLRDLVVSRFQPQLIVNRDLAGRIDKDSRHQRLENEMRIIEAMERAQKRIRANANSRLALEAMTLEMIDA
jgi:DNA polymerase-3 subunit delta'